MRSKIGLITYHSAYNYGSVLQAYATQQTLKDMGYDADILNYRMTEQKFFYNRILSFKYGIRSCANDMTLLLVRRERKKRAKRFEEFIQNNYTLTKEVNEPEEVKILWQSYDLLISGSDQIWNKHSCELSFNNWKYMEPYLLKGFSGKKISYASSVNSMSAEELKRIVPEIKSFDALAFREGASSRRIATMLHKPITTVLDPTFLLTEKKWIEKLKLKKSPQYGSFILFYSLGGLRDNLQWLSSVRTLAKKKKCKVIIVTPFCHIPIIDHHVEAHHEYGPLEFLEAIYNADMIITNSYHGTILSINFEKNFYSVCKQSTGDIRKEDILNRLGLSERILHNPDDLLYMDLKPINYKPVYEKLDILRDDSMAYLRNNISLS